MDEKAEEFLRDHETCYDRFTFDTIFRFLLKNGLEHEEAKDVIIFQCSLSALVFQERVHNFFYKKIKAEDEISKDLLDIKNRIVKDHIEKIITHAINR